MPTYYIMDRDRTMAQTVAAEMPAEENIAACRWLPDAELAVYVREFERNGFQGGLQWYRCCTSGRFERGEELFSGRRIEVPACFIAGAADWGIHQVPGALEAMEERAADWAGAWLVDGAGHWVQQERPDAVSARLTAFASAGPAARLIDGAETGPDAMAARLATFESGRLQSVPCAFR